jgi:hypothetical protein
LADNVVPVLDRQLGKTGGIRGCADIGIIIFLDRPRVQSESETDNMPDAPSAGQELLRRTPVDSEPQLAEGSA